MHLLAEVGVLKHLEDILGDFIKLVVDGIPILGRNLAARGQVSPARKVRNKAALKTACKLLNADNSSLVENLVVSR
jgi:hypothetical protein